jgi:iron complex transport system permease protein
MYSIHRLEEIMMRSKLKKGSYLKKQPAVNLKTVNKNLDSSEKRDSTPVFTNINLPSKPDDSKTVSPGLKNRAVILTFSLSLLSMVIISATVGRYPISIHELFIALRNHFGSSGTHDSTIHLVLFNVRLPRMCAGIIVGAALSSAGACYQGIFRNPMVEPSLLGVTAGSAFGAALAILLSASIAMIQLSAFVFGLISVLITITLSSIVNKHGDKTLSLILCGIVTGTLFSAFLTLAKYVADPYSKLPEIIYWLMGSLASINMTDIYVATIFIIMGLVPLILLRWHINVLSFGDEEAKSLGINSSAIRFVVIISSTLITASAVSISGMIGWIGLVIPHLARMIVGPSFTILLPTSILLGAFFLLFVDTIARVAFPIEIPLGILTAIIGAPFFILLLSRGKRGWI